jgi:hypothetical protein
VAVDCVTRELQVPVCLIAIRFERLCHNVPEDSIPCCSYWLMSNDSRASTPDLCLKRKPE